MIYASDKTKTQILVNMPTILKFGAKFTQNQIVRYYKMTLTHFSNGLLKTKLDFIQISVKLSKSTKMNLSALKYSPSKISLLLK